MAARQADGSFASNCLLARRLAERGVRFVQLIIRLGPPRRRKEAYAEGAGSRSRLHGPDHRPQAARHAQRHVVVWAGEFGRTPMSQGGDGRDHHNADSAFAVRRGDQTRTSFTGDPTNSVTRGGEPLDVHDLHATMLRLLGIEHTRLTVKFRASTHGSRMFPAK